MIRNQCVRQTIPLVLVLVTVCAGCESEPTSDLTYDDLVDRAGMSEIAEGAGGEFVDFYLGEEALRSYVDTGTFTPTEESNYSMIRVPEWATEQALREDGPVTLSLCDPDHGIILFHQNADPGYHALAPDATNCSPWVQHYEGRMTIRYTSGQPGVFGVVQVGVRTNGNLRAGAIMEGALPSTCEGGGIGNSSMFLGTYDDDPAPDDPAIENCRAPEDPEEGP